MYMHAMARDLEKSWQSVYRVLAGGLYANISIPQGQAVHNTHNMTHKNFSVENSSRNTTNALGLHLDNMQCSHIQQNCLTYTDSA